MLAACLLLALAPTSDGAEVYHRVVTRALERVQAGILASVNFEVDHSRWEDPWVVTSAHYQVRTTDSYLQGRQIADNLEYFHSEFTRVLGEGKALPGKLQVWIFPTIADYNRFGQQNGAEHSSMLGSFFAAQHAELPVVTYDPNNATLLGMWITHSALHQYTELAFGPQGRLWVAEGLASYFALFWDWDYAATELERIQKAHSFIPLERLVADPIQAYLDRAHEHFIELGMLFHFLLNSCEATRNGATGDPSTGPFQAFLRKAVRGEDLSDSEFLQTFEEASALLEEDFKAFDFRSLTRDR